MTLKEFLDIFSEDTHMFSESTPTKFFPYYHIRHKETGLCPILHVWARGGKISKDERGRTIITKGTVCLTNSDVVEAGMSLGLHPRNIDLLILWADRRKVE